MSNISIALINTRLQPGGGGVAVGEPFQRLAGSGKTIETVLKCLATVTGLKPGINETALLIYARLNRVRVIYEID